MNCSSSSEVFVEGSSVHLEVMLTVAGEAMNAASVILRVKDPDGTLVVPTVINDGSGAYHADVTAMTKGQWWYRWESVAPDSAQEGSFDVRESRVV